MIDYIHEPNRTARIGKLGGNPFSLFLATICPTGEVDDGDTSIFNSLWVGNSIHFVIARSLRNTGLWLSLYKGHSLSSTNRIPSISSKQAYKSSSNYASTMLCTISGIGRRPLSRTCSAVNIWSLNRGISCLAMLFLLNEGAGMIGAVECMVTSPRERRRIKLWAERCDHVSYGQVQPC